MRIKIHSKQMSRLPLRLAALAQGSLDMTAYHVYGKEEISGGEAAADFLPPHSHLPSFRAKHTQCAKSRNLLATTVINY